jgi:hypothetical protein
MALPVHLVGSIGSTRVFRTCSYLLGPYLKRVSNGEPGGRRLWLGWQYPLLCASSYLQPDLKVHRPSGLGFHPLLLA